MAASWPPGVEAVADCTLALLESLPAGAYADAYELAAAERRGPGAYAALGRTRGALRRLTPRVPRAVPPARVFGEVNIERPAPECGASMVAVLAPAAPGRAPGSRQLQAEVHVAMPVHARYPAPTRPPNTTARVLLLPPRVLLRCAGGAWRVATLADEVAASASVVWQVPAGNVDHARPVELATAVAAVAGASLVLTRLRALGRGKP